MKPLLLYTCALDLSLQEGSASFERNMVQFIDRDAADNNYDVVFLINNLNYSGKFINTIETIGHKTRGKLSYLKHQYQIFKKLQTYLLENKNRENIIYIRTSGMILAQVLAARIYRARLIIRSGGGMSNINSYHNLSAVSNFFIKKYLTFCINSANCVIVVTKGIKKALNQDLGLDPKKVKIVPNPANDSMFALHVNKTNVIESSKQNFIIGYVGSIVFEQRIHDAISAFGFLKKNDRLPSDLKLDIIGGGTYLEACKILVDKYNLSDSVNLLGRMQQTEVLKYYHNFDCCLATYSEKWNNIKGSSAIKVSEYLYFNKFIIAADIEDYQYLEEKKFGMLYQMENHEDLAEKILHVYNNQESTKINARDFIIETRSTGVIFPRYRNLILNRE